VRTEEGAAAGEASTASRSLGVGGCRAGRGSSGKRAKDYLVCGEEDAVEISRLSLGHLVAFKTLLIRLFIGCNYHLSSVSSITNEPVLL